MRLLKAATILALTGALSFGASAQSWQQVGPPGGDVRSLTADPRDARVLYLGTSDGHVFGSKDGGTRWQQLGRVSSPDTVVFTLMVDRRDSDVIFAGTWPLGGGKGGAWSSTDSGKTWKPAGLAGQTVRAITQAPSDLDTLYAGTLDGVYRTRDDGKSWERISPEGHADLRNFDSLAVDPSDPNMIYAGTYHLAWKTSDGGRNWAPIHAGMIDDSDVMSLVLDRNDPNRLFATACSGMYRSTERGERWTKIQGIPFTARRTHFIHQDPSNPRVFYAGTTQGLWKSEDDSLTWRRVTSADWSIIGLVTDPKRPGRLVVGLERRGIVVSENGGATYHTSNTGFEHQQTFLFAMDREQPQRMLVVLTNAAEAVRATEDGGRTWRTLGPGLRPELTNHVYAAPGDAPAGGKGPRATEWWASLTGGGLLRYDSKSNKWLASGVIPAAAAPAPQPAKAAKGKAAAAKRPVVTAKATPFKARVHDMEFASAAWYAATDRGLYTSRDRGRTWNVLAIGSAKNALAYSVRVSPEDRIAVLTAESLSTSTDAGKTWQRHGLPTLARGQIRLEHAGDGLALASESGLYLTRDNGATWQVADIAGRRIGGFVAVEDTLLASTERGLYLSSDGGERWWRVPEEEAEGRFPYLHRIGETESVLAASSTEGLQTVTLSVQVGRNRGRQNGQANAGAAPRQQQD
jgi:photosystem II stability/assembly factor-like uncharacterized protein